MSESGKSEAVAVAAADLWQYVQCGYCTFWRQLNADPKAPIGGPKVGDCFAVPPTPTMVRNPNAIAGAGNEFAVTLLQTRLPENYPACGLFRPRSDKPLPFAEIKTENDKG